MSETLAWCLAVPSSDDAVAENLNLPHVFGKEDSCERVSDLLPSRGQ